MKDSEIIELLGGVTAVARMLSIKPPSVHNWLIDGIPEGRLRDLAGQLEIRSNGRFSRRERWPDKYDFYWPELALAPVKSAPSATENIADAHAAIKHVEAVAVAAIRQEAGQATAEIKHVAEELLKDDESWDGATDRRQADAPWDGKTERRKLDAPVDRRVSPESVARADWLRTQQRASAAHERKDIPVAVQGV